MKVSYDFYCETHGYFEELFCEAGTKEWPCPVCQEPSEQVWLKCSNVDSVAFRFWNNTHDNDLGTFTDKARYHAALKRKGSTIYEAGMDKEAEANNRRYQQKQEEAFKEKVGDWIGSHTLDEVRSMIAADAKITEAQKTGDLDTIRKYGALPSLDDAAKHAEGAEEIYKIPRQL